MAIKFDIEFTESAEQRRLIYDIEECSFDTEPSVREINFDIVVNKLNLTVVDDNRVVQVWGFCDYNEWVQSNDLVPTSSKGTLKVIGDLEGGLSYRVGKDDYETFVNKQTGWVCIGDPKKSGKAVEFVNDCVVVINDDQEFVSLWLKPNTLPQLQ
jgi:hypothetical protein